MGFHLPFDLYYWFVTVFAGGLPIFLAISFLAIAVLAGMFRMPTIITGISFALFIIMLGAITGNLAILVYIGAALIIGWSIARLFR